MTNTAQGADAPDDDKPRRGRPGRRTIEERRNAVLDLLAGKAGIDQLAHKYGVRPETIEKWRQDALGGIEEAMRRGSGSSKRERELEKRLKNAETALTQVSIDRELLKREVDKLKSRPTRPKKSRR